MLRLPYTQNTDIKYFKQINTCPLFQAPFLLFRAFRILVTTQKNHTMKILKWLGIVLVVLFLLFYFVGRPIMIKQTKKHSPERLATFTEMGYDLEVSYNSPSKKGREIFGGLVPYNTVWCTGANEPTVFSTKTDISINGKTLPAGQYSLWTKPSPEQWTVYFNTKIPDWGVNFSGVSWETEYDAAAVLTQVQKVDATIENFTISFERNEDQKPELIMAWDQTKIAVEIGKP